MLALQGDRLSAVKQLITLPSVHINIQDIEVFLSIYL
jgi:hypothetical protein